MRFFIPEGMEANNGADVFEDWVSMMPIFNDFDNFEGLGDFAALIQLGTMFL